jgi:hypothetical protein
LTNPARQTTRAFTIAKCGAFVAEANETFAVNLTNTTNDIIADAQAIGTIIVNDPRAKISIDGVRTTDGNGRTPKLFSFKISLSASEAVAVTVNYATADGTAFAGSDFHSKSGSVTFAPG